MEEIKNKSRYLTYWTITISFFIFILSILSNKGTVPLFVYLFALSSLTCTSLTGTFYLTLPNLEKKSRLEKRSITDIIKHDMKVHILPLAVGVLTLPYVKSTLCNNLSFKRNFLYSLLLFIIMCSIYYYSHDPAKVYFDEDDEQDILEEKKESSFSEQRSSFSSQRSSFLQIIKICGFILLLFCSSYRIYYNTLNE
jgi:hypothetical protein